MQGNETLHASAQHLRIYAPLARHLCTLLVSHAPLAQSFARLCVSHARHLRISCAPVRAPARYLRISCAPVRATCAPLARHLRAVAHAGAAQLVHKNN